MRTNNNAEQSAELPKREYRIDGELIFRFRTYQAHEQRKKVEGEVREADRQHPWIDHDEADNIVPSMECLIENPTNLPNGGSQSVFFAIYPGRRDMHKAQVYAYDKYLRTIAEIVSDKFQDIDEFETRIRVSRCQLCNRMVATGTNSDDEYRKDVLALAEVLGHMGTRRVRMANCLNNMNITCLSQVLARTSEKEWRFPNLGRKTLKAFAKALQTSGIECFVTKAFIGSDEPTHVPDLTLCTLQPLSSEDWERMLQVVGDVMVPVIEFIRKNRNKPVAFGKAFQSLQHGYGTPATCVGGINTTFRQKKLPYRMKISHAIPHKPHEDRTVQILMMPCLSSSNRVQQ